MPPVQLSAVAMVSPFLLQGVHQSLFQTGHILIIHRITQQIIELCGVCAAHFFG